VDSKAVYRGITSELQDNSRKTNNDIGE